MGGVPTSGDIVTAGTNPATPLGLSGSNPPASPAIEFVSPPTMYGLGLVLGAVAEG